MKINVKNPLENLEGIKLTDTDANNKLVPFTIQRAAYNALLSPIVADQLPAMDKFRNYEIAKKIMQSEEVELKVEEIALIKEAIGKAFPAIIVGVVYDEIERSSSPKLKNVKKADL